MKKKKIWKIVIPAVAVVIIGGVVIVNNAVKTGQQLLEAMTVEVMRVETGDVTEIVEDYYNAEKKAQEA